MTPEPRYIFNIDSHFDNARGWIKEYDLFKDTNEQTLLAHKEKEVDKKFFKYMTVMSFSSDEAAKDWFFSHYKSF